MILAIAGETAVHSDVVFVNMASPMGTCMVFLVGNNTVIVAGPKTRSLRPVTFEYDTSILLELMTANGMVM